MKSEIIDNSSHHLLSNFDDKIIGTLKSKTGEVFSVRAITSNESAARNIESLEMLVPIAHETRKRFKENVSSEHDIPNEFIKLERPNDNSQDLVFDVKKIKKGASEIVANFNNNNYTALIVEDSSGKAVSAISFTLNDENKRNNLNIADNQSPLLFLDLSQTLPEHEGKSILKLVRTYFIPKILADSGIEEKVFFTSATKRMKAEDSSNGNILYEDIPNFGVVSRTFNIIDNGNDKTRIYERWRDMELNDDRTIKKIDSEDKRRDGDIGVKLSEFLSPSEKGEHIINQNRLKEWIESSKAQEPTKFLEGCFYITEIDNVRELALRSKENYGSLVDDYPSSKVSNPVTTKSQNNCIVM